MRAELTAPTLSEGLSERARRLVLSRGWGLYLLVVAALVAFVTPGDATGQSQLIYLDPLNVVAVAIFMAAAILYRIPLRVYYALPVIVILVGTAFAFSNTPSVVGSALVVAKEAYLYIWFLVLVTLMRQRGDLKGVRLVWVLTAVAIAGVVVVQVASKGGFSPDKLFAREAGRQKGTFANENMFVDYLMFTTFIVLGLAGQVRWRFLAPAFAVVFLGILTTKSNGGLGSTMVGILTWALTLAWAQSVRPVRLVGGLALGLGAMVLAVWLMSGVGLGSGSAQSSGMLHRPIDKMMGTVGSSAEIRGRIRNYLFQAWLKKPMGIGPGGSAVEGMPNGIPGEEGFKANRDLRRRWPHNDYLGILFERGPFGLLGLLLGMGVVGLRILRSRAHLALRTGSVRAGNILWAAFLGAFVATSVHSLVIDKLHFRHFWLFLAILTALTSDGSEARPAVVRPVSRRTPALTDEGGVALEPQS